ncbi:MAG: OsmC family protein [Rhodothermales bacterium]|nr:OsmC family protein [Rhodothermales bacterium]MCA0268221.1 OsmC family protein [Bacteroidota bacterium]
MVRTGSAVWNGSLTDGSGRLSTQSGALDALPYSFGTRFGDTPGTNPEELLGAAHAACFSMALANAMSKAGQPPEAVETTAKVHLEKGDAGFSIPRIDLTTAVSAPGFDAETFDRLAMETKQGCPVSRVLAGAEISLTATLNG